VEVLEDDADRPAQVGDLLARQSGDVAAVDQHGAAVGDLLPVDEPQQGGLPGSARTLKENELPTWDHEAHLIEGDLAGSIPSGDAQEVDQERYLWMTLRNSEKAADSLPFEVGVACDHLRSAT
jgi:hypothetical protein